MARERIPQNLISFAGPLSLDISCIRDNSEPQGSLTLPMPLAVATLLRDLGGSGAMVAAGFLHDVVEDTEVTVEEIEAQFGPEVRRLVEGVTKLSKFNFSSKTEREAENFRRMFLAMAQDIRVIVVKLADRPPQYANVGASARGQTLPDCPRNPRCIRSLANRLGIWRFKWELEDLAFKYFRARGLSAHAVPGGPKTGSP